MSDFYCKLCGDQKDTIKSLVTSYCSKSPSKLHVPFEGDISCKNFACKLCGDQKDTIKSLVTSYCAKSPSKLHVPFEN